jgi:hypothetical protein
MCPRAPTGVPSACRAPSASQASSTIGSRVERLEPGMSAGVAEDVDGQQRARALGHRGGDGIGGSMLSVRGSMSANTGVARS